MMTDSRLANDWLMMSRRIYEGRHVGVRITGSGTRGRLASCVIAGNASVGLTIGGGADPVVVICK